jgi:hypothetical protein
MILFCLLFYFHDFEVEIKNLEGLKFHKIIINLLFFDTEFILLIFTQV